MTTTRVKVSIDVDVFNSRALWEVAMQRYREENSEETDAESLDREAMNFLGKPDDPEGSTIDEGACLIMLLDPGFMPAGCQITNSSANVTYEEDA